MSDQYIQIPLESIIPNPEQPRKRFDHEKLEELAQSIREHGVIQPIEVEEHGEEYILHDGERRLRASKLVKLATIPAIVKLSMNGSGPEKRLMRTAVANLQRQDMDPIEEGHAYRRFVDDFGYSVHKLSQKLGVTEIRIRHRLLLTNLDEEIQDLIASGDLHRSDKLAGDLLEIEDVQARITLAKTLAAKKLTLKGCRLAAKRLKEALQAKSLESGMPSIYMASRLTRTVFNEEQPPTGWAMLEELDQVPPWERVTGAAVSTCEACELRSMASQEVCGRCPAVMMLQALIREIVHVS